MFDSELPADATIDVSLTAKEVCVILYSLEACGWRRNEADGIREKFSGVMATYKRLLDRARTLRRSSHNGD